jgi:hypothetical protein
MLIGGYNPYMRKASSKRTHKLKKPRKLRQTGKNKKTKNQKTKKTKKQKNKKTKKQKTKK